MLNAHAGDEFAGSAIVSAHEADVDEQRESAWTLADARFSPSRPYFGDPDLFAEPFYLHFESLFTRHDLRRAGVAAALIDAVRAIGLPTFAEFRESWLADVFGRWEVTADSQDDGWLWTQEGLGGSLGIALTLALDGEFLGEPRLDAGDFRIRFRAHAGGERIVARDADYRDRSDTTITTTKSCSKRRVSSRMIESVSHPRLGKKTIWSGCRRNSMSNCGSICARTEAASRSPTSRSTPSQLHYPARARRPSTTYRSRVA